MTREREKILFKAIRKNNLARVIYSIHTKGVNVNCVQREDWDASDNIEGMDSPIHVACQLKNPLPILRYLINNGANINAVGFGHSPLELASYNGDIQSVRYLVAHGANLDFIDDNNETALHQAANAGQLEIYNFLLSCKIDKNIVNVHGQTAQQILETAIVKEAAAQLALINDKQAALFKAVETGNTQQLIEILAVGVEINHTNNRGDTLLHIACKLKDNALPIIQLLVNSGAVINVIGVGSGESALHFASYYSTLDVVKYLRSQGADVNLINWYGETALHQAANAGNISIYNYLVSQGTDTTIKDNDGQTAEEILEEILSVNKEELERYEHDEEQMDVRQQQAMTLPPSFVATMREGDLEKTSGRS